MTCMDAEVLILERCFKKWSWLKCGNRVEYLIINFNKFFYMKKLSIEKILEVSKGFNFFCLWSLKKLLFPNGIMLCGSQCKLGQFWFLAKASTFMQMRDNLLICLLIYILVKWSPPLLTLSFIFIEHRLAPESLWLWALSRQRQITGTFFWHFTHFFGQLLHFWQSYSMLF